MLIDTKPSKEELKRILGIEIENQDLYIEALTHRSILNEIDNRDTKHNERLEFLGDAVLELAITEYLFINYEDRNEGDLTSFRAALVKTESLAQTSKMIGLDKLLIMSKGEELSGGRKRKHILANVYEAVLGAIYLDSGFENVKTFVTKTLVPKLPKIIEKRLDIDSKSKLQEMVKEVIKVTPASETLNEKGLDHQKEFTMSVVVNGYVFGVGNGKSKQEAEQSAAKYALENWEEVYKNYLESATITR